MYNYKALLSAMFLSIEELEKWLSKSLLAYNIDIRTNRGIIVDFSMPAPTEHAIVVKRKGKYYRVYEKSRN